MKTNKSQSKLTKFIAVKRTANEGPPSEKSSKKGKIPVNKESSPLIVVAAECHNIPDENEILPFPDSDNEILEHSNSETVIADIDKETNCDTSIGLPNSDNVPVCDNTYCDDNDVQDDNCDNRPSFSGPPRDFPDATDSNVEQILKIPPRNTAKKPKHSFKEHFNTPKLQSVKGDWRIMTNITVPYTIVNQKWKFINSEGEEIMKVVPHICPLGMVKTYGDLLVTHKYKTLVGMPQYIKDHFKITKENYQSDNMEITSTYIGDCGPRKFHHISCKICDGNLPELLTTNLKVPADEVGNPKVHFINNFDNYECLPSLVPFAGLLWSPFKNVMSGPNNLTFLHKPSFHYKNWHLKTVNIPRPIERNATQPDANVDDPVQNIPGHEITATNSKKNKINCLTQPMKQVRMLDNRVGVHEPCIDQLDKFAKGVMIRYVMIGVYKMVSHYTVIEFYQEQSYIKYHENFFKDIEINNKKLKAPPGVKLNRKNILDVEEAVWNDYRLSKDNENPYRILETSKFFSIMFDATTEYVKSVNAIFVRTVGINGKIYNFPFELRRLKGSLTSKALSRVILDATGEIGRLKDNAFDIINSKLKEYIDAKEKSVSVVVKVKPQEELKVLTDVMSNLQQSMQFGQLETLLKRAKYLKENYDIEKQELDTCNVTGLGLPEYNEENLQEEPFLVLERPDLDNFPLSKDDYHNLTPPPKFFSQVKLNSIQDDTITVICPRSPTGLAGDGCSVNTKCTKILQEKIGIFKSFNRDTPHRADNTLKRLAKSKTRCVSKVVEMQKALKSLVKHFSKSPNHTECLNEAISMLDLLPLKTLNWSSTRFGGLLSACNRIMKILVPFLDTLITCGIKPESTEKLLTPISLNILLYLGELKDLYFPLYLKRVDESYSLISEVEGITQKFMLKMREFKPTLAEEFAQNLRFDENHNLYAFIFVRNKERIVESDESDNEINLSDDFDDDESEEIDDLSANINPMSARRMENSEGSEESESENSGSDLEEDEEATCANRNNENRVYISNIPKKPGYTAHKFLLNYSWHALRGRGTNDHQLTKIKKELSSMNNSIMKNILDNTADQNPTEGIEYLFSALDLDSTDDLQERKEKICKIHELYGVDKWQTMQDVNADNDEPWRWNGMKIEILYSKVLNSTAHEINEDLERAWEKFGILSARRDKEKNKPTQYELLLEFISKNMMVYPHLINLIKLMFSILPNTSIIERSYSHLSIICDKRRSHLKDKSLECLYMLKSLNIQPKQWNEYENVIKLLELTKEERSKLGYKSRLNYET